MEVANSEGKIFLWDESGKMVTFFTKNPFAQNNCTLCSQKAVTWKIDNVMTGSKKFLCYKCYQNPPPPPSPYNPKAVQIEKEEPPYNLFE